ncbi:MAG: hypothetical protein ACI8RZ_007786 [Myxococcota bacterium]
MPIRDPARGRGEFYEARGALSQGRSQPGALSARGALSLVAFDSEGASLTGRFRFAIVDAILFLATPLQRWPFSPLMSLRSKGVPLSPFTTLQLLSPGATALRPLPLGYPPCGPQPVPSRRYPQPNTRSPTPESPTPAAPEPPCPARPRQSESRTCPGSPERGCGGG